MNSFQTSYNWLITDCVAYPKNTACADCIAQAVDYEGFWKEDLSIQHPLAAVELAAYDSSAVLLLSRESTPIQSFRQAFTHSRDLKEYNTAVIQTCRETSIHPA